MTARRPLHLRPRATGHWPLATARRGFSFAEIMFAVMILAIGFIQLFVDTDLSPSLPAWLQVTSLDQLKNKLVGVLAVLLGVTFTAKVVEWDGGRDVLYLGLAIAAVIVALGLLISIFERHDGEPSSPDNH